MKSYYYFHVTVTFSGATIHYAPISGFCRGSSGSFMTLFIANGSLEELWYIMWLHFPFYLIYIFIFNYYGSYRCLYSREKNRTCSELKVCILKVWEKFTITRRTLTHFQKRKSCPFMVYMKLAYCLVLEKCLVHFIELSEALNIMVQ